MSSIDDKFHELTCDLQRSACYHRARERFFQNWSSAFDFITLLSGSAVVVSVISQSPHWISLTAGIIIASAQALQLVVGLNSKARLHGSLATDFLALERELVAEQNFDEQRYRLFCSRMKEIEMREPPIMRYLDVICHNQVAYSLGSSDVYHVSWLQRRLAHWYSGHGFQPRKRESK